jgi:hypothetical protein
MNQYLVKKKRPKISDKEDLDLEVARYMVLTKKEYNLTQKNKEEMLAMITILRER